MSNPLPIYADRVILTIKDTSLLAQEDESITSEASILSYRLRVDLDSDVEIARERIQSLVYSEDSVVPPHFVFEQRYRQIEIGASGVEYEIIVAVMSGLAANVGAELLKALAGKMVKARDIKSDEALGRALGFVVETTELPKRLFELLYAKENDQSFSYMFLEKATDRKFYVRISKKLAVIEYQVYGPGFIPEQEN